MLNKIKCWALELKAKMAGEQYISFEEAVKILRDELNYPEDRALHFVKQYDKNKDGKLSVTEFSTFRNKIEETKTSLLPRFREYDRDNNGYITIQEASSILQKPPFCFPPGKVVVLLTTFDKDKNGKLDIVEFADFFSAAKAFNEDMASRFDQLDKNGDGVLSPDEVTSVIQSMLGFDDPQMARKIIQMFDQNDDGSLDKTEFMQLWTNMFA